VAGGWWRRVLLSPAGPRFAFAGVRCVTDAEHRAQQGRSGHHAGAVRDSEGQWL